MGYKLCMAEKPSVAKEIAAVIGANKRCNGYFEGNGYRVTWAVGHLVGLAEPESYGFVSQKDMYNDKEQKAYDELPLIPSEFKLIVLEPTKEQFNIVKTLINSDDVDEIINCGDMGAEGHILQWFIREKAGCTKKVRRFCATSMTEEAIRHAFENLHPEEEFKNIIKGEFCKKKADWIMGISLSRAESIKYNTGINVGRVQSPTLYFIVKRYLDVQNFKVTDYYGMKADLKEGFSVVWNKDNDGIFPQSIKDSENRVLSKEAIEEKCAEITKGKKGIVTDITVQKKRIDRPQLYDITELQRDANRIYGYSAALTLSNAQSLYETHKVLSYPRTDSRYLTSDLESYIPEIVEYIKTVDNKYERDVSRLITEGLNIDSKIIGDKKVTDHHALLPTKSIKDFNPDNLIPSDKEKKEGVTRETLKNIFDLVLCRVLISFSKAYTYEQKEVEITACNAVFKALRTIPVEYGWKEIRERLLGKEEEDSNDSENSTDFPELVKNQEVNILSCMLTSKKTTPPKLHTEATLLTAMENAGAAIENGAILKGKGIGTQATRAEIIKKLFDLQYCELKKTGKTNYIIPTAKGLQIIRVLPPELYSPKITADWEKKISLIASGEMTEEEFMSDFTGFISDKVNEVKNSDTGIVFKNENKVVGKCPFCGGDILKYQKKGEKKISFYCKEKTCPFSLNTDNPTVLAWTGKKLTEKQCLEIVNNNEVILECKFKNGSGTYRGRFTPVKKEVGDKVFTNLKCEPLTPQRKK